MCGPVFNEFMAEAIQKYGSGPFEAPAECAFYQIDRFSGAPIGPGGDGSTAVSECFRIGEEPIFGVTFDGGFAMGSNFERIEGGEAPREITTSTGQRAVVGPKASFGTLSSGGLY